MRAFHVEEVRVQRTEHFAVVDVGGRAVAYTNNGDDARRVMFALNLAEQEARRDT